MTPLHRALDRAWVSLPSKPLERFAFSALFRDVRLMIPCSVRPEADDGHSTAHHAHEGGVGLWRGSRSARIRKSHLRRGNRQRRAAGVTHHGSFARASWLRRARNHTGREVAAEGQRGRTPAGQRGQQRQTDGGRAVWPLQGNAVPPTFVFQP